MSVMPELAKQLRVEERFSAKEAARRQDAAELDAGVKSPSELKRDNESFAFPVSRARVNLKSAQALI